MRWDKNFAAILRDMGMNLSYSVISDENGFCFTRIVVEYKKGGILIKKELKEFLEEKRMHLFMNLSGEMLYWLHDSSIIE